MAKISDTLSEDLRTFCCCWRHKFAIKSLLCKSVFFYCWQWHVNQQYRQNVRVSLLFDGKNCYAKAPQCCVIHVLPVLLSINDVSDVRVVIFSTVKQMFVQVTFMFTVKFLYGCYKIYRGFWRSFLFRLYNLWFYTTDVYNWSNITTVTICTAMSDILKTAEVCIGES